jgi:hypothetical protein
VVEECRRHQYVADALELSAREDSPGFDRCVRLIFQLSHGDPEGDGLMAETLYDVASRLRQKA